MKDKEFDEYAPKEYDQYCKSDNKEAWVEKKVAKEVVLKKKMNERMLLNYK